MEKIDELRKLTDKELIEKLTEIKTLMLATYGIKGIPNSRKGLRLANARIHTILGERGIRQKEEVRI